MMEQKKQVKNIPNLYACQIVGLAVRYAFMTVSGHLPNMSISAIMAFWCLGCGGMMYIWFNVVFELHSCESLQDMQSIVRVGVPQ